MIFRLVSVCTGLLELEEEHVFDMQKMTLPPDMQKKKHHPPQQVKKTLLPNMQNKWLSSLTRKKLPSPPTAINCEKEKASWR